ncbi:MAG: chorismate mutase [Acidimicrobiia bacterium]|nr:chorismate mutase [Acidimicrobiia bacterium]
MAALRGATTVDDDTRDAIKDRVVELLCHLVERNHVDHDDVVSILFTATDDVHAMFPAEAARGIGYGDVPLICARELEIAGATARCVRVLLHIETTRPRADLHHVYLHGARGLRDDLPE